VLALDQGDGILIVGRGRSVSLCRTAACLPDHRLSRRPHSHPDTRRRSLVEGGGQRPIEEVGKENSLCCGGVVQQRRLRVAKGSFSTAFVSLGGVSMS